MYIEDILKVKEQRVVRVSGKKIEKLTDEEIQEISLDTFKSLLEQTKTRVANDNENRNKKKFAKVDYLERERRSLLKGKIEQTIPENEEELFGIVRDNAKTDYEDNQRLKVSISKVAPEVVII